MAELIHNLQKTRVINSKYLDNLFLANRRVEGEKFNLIENIRFLTRKTLEEPEKKKNMILAHD